MDLSQWESYVLSVQRIRESAGAISLKTLQAEKVGPWVLRSLSLSAHFRKGTCQLCGKAFERSPCGANIRLPSVL